MIPRQHRHVWLLVPALALANSAAAHAETCTGFKWPVETELSWLQAPEAEQVASGGELAAQPGKAIAITLEPTPSVKFPVQPGIKKQALGPDTYSGWFTLQGVTRPGLYQISLSRNGWVDIAQNGELIQSSAFTGNKDCAALHKSVRFEIGPGPLTIQLAGLPQADLKITIKEAN